MPGRSGRRGEKGGGGSGGGGGGGGGCGAQVNTAPPPPPRELSDFEKHRKNQNKGKSHRAAASRKQERGFAP
jgi:hypothetical protein